jgi:hypothetical protein
MRLWALRVTTCPGRSILQSPKVLLERRDALCIETQAAYMMLCLCSVDGSAALWQRCIDVLGVELRGHSAGLRIQKFLQGAREGCLESSRPARYPSGRCSVE